MRKMGFGGMVLKICEKSDFAKNILLENALMTYETKFSQVAEKRSPPDTEFETKPPTTLMHSTEFDLLKERFITEGDEKYLRQNPYLRMDYPRNSAKYFTFI